MVRRSPLPRATGVLQGVLQVEEHAWCRARIALVHQHRATAQEVAVAFERQVERGVQQRVAGADEGRQGLALRRDEGFLEGDALVARQHRFTDADEAIAVADGRWHMGHFIAARLPLASRPPSCLKASRKNDSI